MKNINQYVKISLHYRGDKGDQIKHMKIKDNGRNLSAIFIESKEPREEIPEFPPKYKLPKKQLIRF